MESSFLNCVVASSCTLGSLESTACTNAGKPSSCTPKDKDKERKIRSETVRSRPPGNPNPNERGRADQIGLDRSSERAREGRRNEPSAGARTSGSSAGRRRRTRRGASSGGSPRAWPCGCPPSGPLGGGGSPPRPPTACSSPSASAPARSAGETSRRNPREGGRLWRRRRVRSGGAGVGVVWASRSLARSRTHAHDRLDAIRFRIGETGGWGWW